MFLLSNMRFQTRQVAPNVTWASPQGNETLLAGQNYTAKWNSSSVPRAPTFQLCVDSPVASGTAEGSCGAWVPAPVQVGDGLYFVSLTLPNVSSTYPFVLKMHDEPDPDSVSPSFFIQPASMENKTTSDTNSGTMSPQSAETPGLAFQLPQTSKETDTLVVMAPDAPHAARKKRSDLQEVFPHPTPLFIGFSIIPIVLLTGAFVTFVVMWIRQRRQGQLKRLYLTDYPMIYPRRPVPKSLNSYEDLEDAVQTLSYERYKSGKPSSQPKESKLRIVSNRLKRRERQEDNEKREMQGRGAAPAGPRALPHHGKTSERDAANPFSDEYVPPSRPTSYVPEPRNLTDSYFPQVQPPSDLPSYTARGQGPSGFGEEYDGGHVGAYGLRLVESPMGMSPPPPSVTKLSERLHLRSRSESSGGSSRGYDMEKQLRAGDLR